MRKLFLSALVLGMLVSPSMAGVFVRAPGVRFRAGFNQGFRANNQNIVVVPQHHFRQQNAIILQQDNCPNGYCAPGQFRQFRSSFFFSN